MNKKIEILTPNILQDYNNVKIGQSIKYLIDTYNIKPEIAKAILNDNDKNYTQKREGLKQTEYIKWFAKFQGEILHADIFFIPVKKQEQGKHSIDNYIPKSNKLLPYLIAVDVYSRYLWIFPLNKKSNIIEPFKEIVNEIKKVNPNIIKIKVVTDEGKEFFPLKEILDIIHFKSKSKFGAAIAESHINRIKQFIKNYSTFNINWSDVALNLNTVNSNRKDIDGKHTTAFDLFNNKTVAENKIQKPNQEYNFKQYDFVRVHNKILDPLQKRSSQKYFSDNIYYIDDIKTINGIKKYYVYDIKNKILLKRFYYGNELKLITDKYISRNNN